MNRSRSPVLSQMKFHQAQTIRKAELMAEDAHCAICRSELVARYGASNSAVLADGVLKCSSCIELLSTPKPRIPRIAGEVHEMTAEQVKASPELLRALAELQRALEKPTCPVCGKPMENRVACPGHVGKAIRALSAMVPSR